MRFAVANKSEGREQIFDSFEAAKDEFSYNIYKAYEDGLIESSEEDIKTLVDLEDAVNELADATGSILYGYSFEYI